MKHSRIKAHALGASTYDGPTSAILELPKADLLKLQAKMGFGGEWGFIHCDPNRLPRNFRYPSAHTKDIVTKCGAKGLKKANRDMLIAKVTAMALFLLLTPSTRWGTLLALTTWLRRVDYLLQLSASLIRRGVLPGPTFFAHLEPIDYSRSANLTTWIQIVHRDYHDTGQLQDWPEVAAPRPARVVDLKRAPGDLTKAERKEAATWQPLPHEFVAEVGWRCLWIIDNIGPQLVQCIEAFDDYFLTAVAERAQWRRAYWFKQYTRRPGVWLCDGEREVIPPFAVHTNFRRSKMAVAPWPPKHLEAVRRLAVLLQSANMFVTLLSLGGRSGEMNSFDEGAVSVKVDGTTRAEGMTYKLVFESNGVRRDWPVADVAGRALLLQDRLAKGWKRLFGGAEAGAHLWVSFGDGSNNRTWNYQLQELAKAFGLKHLLGEEHPSVHTHRFRKTTAQLVGLTVAGASKVLMDLFGHRSIETVLGYMLSDRDFNGLATEAARAQKIMYAEQILETAEGNGGPAAPRVHAVLQSERARHGRELGAKDRHDLAGRMTMQGRALLQVRPGVFCLKMPGQVGPCTKRAGAPEPSRCRPSCGHRLEQALLKDDVDRSLASIVADLARAQKGRNHYEVESLKGQLLAHLPRFPSLQAKWLKDATVAAVAEEAKQLIHEKEIGTTGESDSRDTGSAGGSRKKQRPGSGEQG